MSFVLTRSGDRFDAGDPESYVPEPMSVALTLARIPRFNGHHDRAFSVAHHCVAGAWVFEDFYDGHEYGDDAALAFLVHDAHETILGDIPSPLKPYIAGLGQYESRLEQHFMAALGGPRVLKPSVRRTVKALDRIIVAVEAQCLGLDDGWTREREEEHTNGPPLSLIRSRVEAVAPMDPNTVATIWYTMWGELSR